MRDPIASSLAVIRITDLVVEDEISRPIRDAVNRRWPDSKVSYLVSCKKCVSVWAALLVTSGLLPRRVVWALALSGAAVLADRQDDRLGAIASAQVRKQARS